MEVEVCIQKSIELQQEWRRLADPLAMYFRKDIQEHRSVAIRLFERHLEQAGS
jgi:hypothetical protein